ncbi:MAG: hypothetical protein AAGA56_30080, partial [Myxococcota bacterium]
MRLRAWFVAAVVAWVTLPVGPALAVNNATYGSHLEFANGVSTRAIRTTVDRVPHGSERAWKKFKRLNPGRWVGSWDAATGVAHRIWGEGIAAPSTNRDPAAAEAFARAFLTDHLDEVVG